MVDSISKEIVIQGGVFTISGFLCGYQSEGGDIGKFEFYRDTELKDKNGVEIYEGDIMKSIEGDIDTVIFEDYGYCFKESTTGFSKLRLEDWKWEVIGNIYQNPELLN